MLTVQWVQQEEAHCGPATVKMLFSFHGVQIGQSAISSAAGMADIIQDAAGMRLDELNDGVKALYPQGEYSLLARYHATIDDIEHLTEHLGIPVGVEWQGKFPDGEGGYYDQGHYSVLVGVDRTRGKIQIVDPEPKNVLTKDGELPIATFEQRWWEVDIVPQVNNRGVTQVIEMEHLLFSVVPQHKVAHLKALGFRPATLALIWEHCTPLEA